MDATPTRRAPWRGVNAAGAGGPMQFLASHVGRLRGRRRWRRHGRSMGRRRRDLRSRQLSSRLRRPRRLPAAIFAYNHANWYVAEVESWAARYRRQPRHAGDRRRRRRTGSPKGRLRSSMREPDASSASSRETRRARPRGRTPRADTRRRTRTSAGDGRGRQRAAGTARTAPAAIPTRSARAKRTARARVNYVLYRSGVRPLGEILERQPARPGLRALGCPGPGRWVTIYATDAPDSSRVHGHRRPAAGHEPRRHRRRPQPVSEGPRWRILGHIPTWAHWSVRHPPGAVRWRRMAGAQVDYLLIGGGLAPQTARAGCGRRGADGEVLLVGRELDPPYNRPECSKGYLRGEENREEPLFPARRVVGRAEHRAADAHERHRARPLGAHGEALQQGGDRVRQGADRHRRERAAAERRRLRARGDPLPAHARQRRRDPRRASSDAEHVVLIGGSYIACEVAASLTMLGKRCTIVMQEEHHARTGVRRAGRALLSGAARDRTASPCTARTSSSASRETAASPRSSPAPGCELAAEAVVVGAGVAARRAAGRSAPVSRSASGEGCAARSRLESSVPGVFAAGDVCEYESIVHGGAPCASSTGTSPSTTARPPR